MLCGDELMDAELCSLVRVCWVGFCRVVVAGRMVFVNMV